MSRVPRWTRAVVGGVGFLCLVLGAMCFFAAQAVFGTDAYRTLTRVPIGLLGALATGVGVTALLASFRGEARELRTLVTGLFVSAALVPPVVGFNIGAFDRIDTSGARTLTVVVLFVMVVATPLQACLLVLNRMVKAGDAT